MVGTCWQSFANVKEMKEHVALRKLWWENAPLLKLTPSMIKTRVQTHIAMQEELVAWLEAAPKGKIEKGFKNVSAFAKEHPAEAKIIRHPPSAHAGRNAAVAGVLTSAIYFKAFRKPTALAAGAIAASYFYIYSPFLCWAPAIPADRTLAQLRFVKWACCS
eukprot:GILJ01003378.1.p1 GENE.GILJ01003378.1~~GILJ01003378.1.p1  ORF type:complete len:161 (-),score=17.52 GILJ01003378.1:66-548(-)